MGKGDVDGHGLLAEGDSFTKDLEIRVSLRETRAELTSDKSQV